MWHVRLGFPLNSTNDLRCLPQVHVLISIELLFFFQCVIQKGLQLHHCPLWFVKRYRWDSNVIIMGPCRMTYESVKITVIQHLLAGSNSQPRKNTRSGQAEVENYSWWKLLYTRSTIFPKTLIYNVTKVISSCHIRYGLSHASSINILLFILRCVLSFNLILTSSLESLSENECVEVKFNCRIIIILMFLGCLY